MAFPDEPQGAETPSGDPAPHPTNEAAPGGAESNAAEPASAGTLTSMVAIGAAHEGEAAGAEAGQPVTDPREPASGDPHIPEPEARPATDASETPVPTEAEPPQAVTGEVITDNPPRYYDPSEPYGDEWSSSGTTGSTAAIAPPPAEPPGEAPPPRSSGGSGKPPKPPEPPEDDEEDGMARMSFLEHLEELRKRIILALSGVGVAFVLCLIFSDNLWNIVFEPAGAALRSLNVNPPTLKLISPTDAFQIMWMKVPILFAVFLASPWVLYQVWAFISPGLYKKERRYAAPFVVSSAGLFVLGGLFAYFIAFRYGLEFLLGIGMGKGIDPSVNVNEYYDIFVDVMLGVGIVFEIPILLFLLTLLHIVKPAFLVRHSRYAILAIVILAAVITPTGDVFNLALFATPMIVLFYVGIFASYLLVLRREKQRFPWRIFFKWTGIVLIVAMVVALLAAKYYGYHIMLRWPIFVK